MAKEKKREEGTPTPHSARARAGLGREPTYDACCLRHLGVAEKRLTPPSRFWLEPKCRKVGASMLPEVAAVAALPLHNCIHVMPYVCAE